MPEAIRYLAGDNVLTITYLTSDAQLPVRLRNGQYKLLPWGRRHDELGNLPFGPHASLHQVYSGWWDKFFPHPVKIPYLAFMEQDFEGRTKWYENGLKSSHYIQGLIAKDRNELRVYIVTEKPETEIQPFHDRWPRIITHLNEHLSAAQKQRIDAYK